MINEKKQDRFAFLKNPQFWGLVSLGFALIMIPIIVYVALPKQQEVRQHAAFYTGQQQYYCAPHLGVILNVGGEQPPCSNGVNPNAATYQSTVAIAPQSWSSGQYKIHWMWAQYWCADPNTSPCLDHFSGAEHVVDFNAGSGQTVTMQSDARGPVGFPPQACGVYQNDFGFYITDNSDSSQKHLCTNVVLDNSLGTTNNNAAWCKTGNSCNVPPTNTPIPPPTNTPIPPTNTPVPTGTPVPPTDTPGVTITPTDTPPPGTTPTDTPTPTVTPTPPPGSTPTLTSTPGPTATPGPSATPTVTPRYSTPHPTLPPTGPDGNALVGVGLAGVVIALLGGILILGL